jgi:hypothetical protein
VTASSLRFGAVSRRFLLLAATGLSGLAARAQEVSVKLTYDDHIRPVLENKCFSCHNPDKKKGGLDMTSYAGLVAGGGGGAVVDPGNPGGSRLWTCSTQKEEPFMPPEGSPLPAKDLALLSKWIADGVLQSKGSVARAANRPKVDLTLSAGAGKPTGPVARPEHVLLDPIVVTQRLTAVTAMAASPWTSLLAVAGQKQILLYDTESRELAGVLPYPEGYARSLKFSANGSLLIMGGGRGGKFGHAVVWDVKSGRRVTEVGKEFDQLMSADISPDHKRIAVGTNAKKVKCFDTATGELLYTISKHTEWVTGADFSPDGILLATSDRNGNVMVWESENGGEFFNLGQHKASVTDLAWRSDSNVLASCSTDGTITTWELKTGKRVANWAAHGGSVQSVAFTPDGRLLSCGNDGTTALWTIDGKRLTHARGIKQADVVSKIVALADSKVFVTGNWLGEVRFFDVESGQDLTQVSVNPPKLAERIAEAEKQLVSLRAKAMSAPADAQAATAQLRAAEAENAAILAASAEVMKKLNAVEARYQPPAKELEAMRNLSYKTTDEKARAELNAKIKVANDALTPAKTERRTLLELAAKVSLDLDWIANRLVSLQDKVKNDEGSLAYSDKVLASAKSDEKTKASTQKQRETQATALEFSRGQLASLQARQVVVQGQMTTLNKLKTDAAATEAFTKNSLAQISGWEEHVAFLRAAEFNVGVLAEKERLAKLEADIADAIAAKAENEMAHKAALARVTATTQQVADLAAKLPPLEAAWSELKAALPALEAPLGPLRQAEAEAAGKVEAQTKLLGECQALLGEAIRQRDTEVAAAKAAIEEYGRIMRPVRLRVAELTTRVETLKKDAATAATELTQAKAAAAAVQAKVDAAERKLAASLTAGELTEKRLQAATAQVTKASEADASTHGISGLLSLRYFTSRQETAARLAAALTELAEAKHAVAQAQAARFADVVAVTQAGFLVAGDVAKVHAARAVLLETEKQLGPDQTELAEQAKVRLAQQKEYAVKQAAPAAVEKAYVAKLAPHQAAVDAAQAALAPMQQAITTAKARLAEAALPSEAKKQAIVAAAKTLDEAKAKWLGAQKALAAATKEVPDREKNLAELARTIADLSPQVEPQRAKVKAAESAYLAKLPKRNVAQAK